MTRILVSDKLSPLGMKILKGARGLAVDCYEGLSPAELKKIIKNYEGWVIRSGTKVTKELIQAAQRLKIIGRAGIGVDNVDLKAASKKGVIVMNTPSGNSVTTAEHALAMMFAICRRIPQAVASTRAGQWERKKFTGNELANKTLGIIGVGNIGRIVATRALGLKMNVIGFDPFLSQEVAGKLGVKPVSLEALLKNSDLITIHTPLNEKTRGLIGAEEFKKMKRGVYFINCARGGLVDEKALLAAVKSGHVAGAAVDVLEKEPAPKNHPFLKEEHIIVTPHVGAATDEAQLNVAREIAEQMVDFFESGTVKNAVNFPSVSGEVLKVMQPYLNLAEKLGSLEGQLCHQTPQEVKIEYQGDLCQANMGPLTSSVLKGLLAPVLSDVSINYVNAPVIAKERGIKIVEAKVSEVEDFTHQITVTTKTNGMVRSVSGTVFGKRNPRIVRINEFYLEAVPEGQILVIYNHDRPGVIGRLGTYLGKSKINIARMQLGLVKKRAMALYNVEGRVTAQVLRGLEKLPNIISVHLVTL